MQSSLSTFGSRLALVAFSVLIALSSTLAILYTRSERAYAATNSNINFQARVLTAAGGVVPDGAYNVQFNLYSQASGGSSLWTETYLNSATQGIVAKNGYITASLGSLTAFPNTIQWDQELWIGMTIRGTGSCAFAACTPADAEMTPRMKVTAVPYAFRAAEASQVKTINGANVSTLSIAAPTGGSQTFTIPDQGAAGSYTILTQNAANASYIQNQSSTPQTANYYIQSAGSSTVGAIVRGAVSQSAALMRYENSAGDALAVFGANGQLTLGNDAATPQIGSITFNDSTAANGYTAVLTSAAALTGNVTYRLPVAGAGTYDICTSAGNCLGGGDIIQNGNSYGTAINIGSNDNYDVNIETFGVNRLTVQNDGDVAIDTNTLFVDATNNRVGIVNAAPGNPLSVNTPTTADSLAQALISTGAAGNKGLVVQGVAGQTVNIFEVQTSTGTSAFHVYGNGNGIGTNNIYASGGLANSGTSNNAYIRPLSTGTYINTAVDSNIVLTLQNIGATPTGDMLQLKNNSGVVQSGFNIAGNLFYSNSTYNSVLSSATLTANRSIILPNEDGTICTTGSVCTGYAPSATNGYVQLAPASAQTDATNNSSIYINKTSGTGNILQLQKAGVDVVVLNNTGDLTVQNATIAAGKSLTITGGNTASRPGSPVEGMMYYDTTTKNVLIYSNGKWQADRSTATKIVAASNASQALKDSADYVVSGNADDEINAALTAAAGGSVYLTEGTFVAGATILIPNNTTLAGAGRGTLIELADLDATENLIENTDMTTGTGVTIRDMKLDGRNDLNTAGTQHAIYFDYMGNGINYASRQGGYVQNVVVEDFRNNAIYLNHSSNSTITGIISQRNSAAVYVENTNNISISNTIALGNTYGFAIVNSSYINLSNTTAQDSAFGISMNTSTRNTVSGYNAAANTTAIRITSSSNNVFSGVTAAGNTDNILIISSNNNSFTGNLINNTTSADLDAFYLDASDNNTITGNNIIDVNCVSNCYAINISNNTSDNNYLADNNFSSSTGTAIINDAGTGTVFANQPMAENGLNLLVRTVNSASAFSVQGSNKVNVFNVNTTSGSVEVGSYNSGTNPVAGKIVIANANNANTITLQSATTPTANRTISLPDEDGTICLQNSTNCGFALSATNGYVQLAPASAQTDTTTNSSIFINKTGASGNILQLQKNGSDVVVVSNTGALTASQLLTANLGATISGATISLNDNSNFNTTINTGTSTGTVTVGNGAAGNITLQSGGTIRLNGATDTLVQQTTSSTTAFEVKDQTGASIFGIDASNRKVSVGAYTAGTGIGQLMVRPANNSSVGISIVPFTGANVDAFQVYTAGYTPTGTQDANQVTFRVSETGVIGSADTTTASSRDTTLRSGNTSFAGGVTGNLNLQTGANATSGNTGAINITTGNATSGNSGNISVDAGTASGTAGTISIGATNTTAITLGRTGITTTNAGALTVTQLLTGNLGATISGAAISLNDSSNFATTINTGTSTGAVTIGNATNANNAVTLVAGATGGISLNSSKVDSSAATLNMFNSPTTISALQAATSISLGATTGTLTVRNANTTIGNAAGSGVFTNNGATFNATLALNDLAAGSIGANTATVDVYTSFSINPSASGRTYTIPTPSSNVIGRVIYVSNINGTNSFIIGGTTFNPGSTATMFYNGSTWAFAGMDGGSNNYIQNQTATDQAASYRISGTGAINATSATAFRVQSAAAADTMFTVDTSAANQVKVGNNTGTGAATTLFVLDSATTSAGLATTVGAMYYDTTANRIQCYEGTTWGNCGNTTLQEAYTSSTGGTTPEVLLDSTRNALDIQDANTTLGANAGLLSVRASATASTLGASLFVVNGNGRVGISNGTTATTAALSYDLSFGQIAGATTARTIGVEAQGTAATGGNGLTLTAGTGNTTGVGGVLTLQGGNGGNAAAGGNVFLRGGTAGGGNTNGGDVTVSGGTGAGTGLLGVVKISNPVYNTATEVACGADCNITQANVSNNGSVIVSASATGLNITLLDPTVTTAGRVVYITAANGSQDFTLRANVGGGTGLEQNIAMRQNTTATMIWNGTDWTAAGASSSTTLQAAYDNTLTAAGGAEIILNNTASANGLTVRNNATNPIIGGIFEAQTSIGSNLFSVNNNATEYATNGGAETQGGSTSTFPANTWDTTTGGTVDRWTTTGDNVATGAASVRVQTTTTNHGARNRINATLTTGLTYSVSFAVRGATNFSTLQVLYSPDGTTTGTTQCATAETVTSGIWTRVSCTFVASGTITASNSILIRQTDATARTFYIDNLSVNVNASATYAADGGVDNAGAFATNWGDFDGGTGSTTVTRDTATIYDTSASVSGVTTANATQGIRNNMAITPALNTQYLVSFYARSSNTMTNSLSAGFLPAGGTTAPTGTALCTDYNTQSLVANTWTKITCLFTTTGAAITNPDLVIYQTDGTARTINIDALTITLNTNNANNVQIGGANKGGPTTLFTLDRSDSAPIAANNEAYLGSMYYDTTSGRIQCYEADGWGACGSAPDNIVNLNPEYAGAVLNGTGVGTMTADFCGNGGGLAVNTGFCASGEARNFYKWTSPQATQQTYSIYVTYQLPSSFKGFANDDTVQLTARTDNTTNGVVSYQMYRNESGVISACGTETNVTSSANTWQTVGINGNEATGCNFTTSSANAFVIFKINVKANSNASVYVGTLSFTTTGR